MAQNLNKSSFVPVLISVLILLVSILSFMCGGVSSMSVTAIDEQKVVKLRNVQRKKNKNKEKINLKRHLRIQQHQEQGNIRREELLKVVASKEDRDASGNLNNNLAWKSLRDVEEDGCVRRFLCELAAGQITLTSAKDNNYKILVKQLIQFVDNRMNEENAEDKNVLLYAEAAKSGSIHLDAEKCRLKYPCPATGSQMYSIFRLTSSN